MPLGGLRVIWSSVHECSELSDTVNLVTGKKSMAELREVKPLVGRFFHSSIVEVEAIYVDICSHHRPLKTSKGRHDGGLGPAAEATGAVSNNIVTHIYYFCQYNINKLGWTSQRLLCLNVVKSFGLW